MFFNIKFLNMISNSFILNMISNGLNRLKTNRLNPIAHSIQKKLKATGLFAFILVFMMTTLLLPAPVYSLTPKNLGPIIAEIESQIQSDIQNKRIPGCAIAIVYRGQIVYTGAYGVKTMGKPDKIDVDTVFQLGSVSKPVAATLAVLLENQGYFNLDQPVSNYLQNFSLKGQKDPKALKVRNILSHSSGVPRNGFNSLIESHNSFDTILKALQNKKVVSQPGRHYDYNNAMYSVIADITEKTTHATFSEALTVKLLRPLNMTKTTASHAGILLSANRATPHTHNKKGLVPSNTYTSSYYNVVPAGGINSSIRDMGKFLQAQMGGAPSVVTPKMIARMQSPEVVTGNMLNFYDGSGTRLKNPRYGLGWRLIDFAGERMVFHGGWLKGFTNFVGFLPDHQVGIVILHNSDTRFASRLGLRFFELFLELPKLSIPTKAVKRGPKKIKSSQTTAGRVAVAKKTKVGKGKKAATKKSKKKSK